MGSDSLHWTLVIGVLLVIGIWSLKFFERAAMSSLTLSTTQRLPAPQTPLAFRLATLADIPALDALQKKHHKALGFFPRAQMEGYVEAGGILIAEAHEDGGWKIEEDRIARVMRRVFLHPPSSILNPRPLPCSATPSPATGTSSGTSLA
jgi:hypothetical protein